MWLWWSSLYMYVPPLPVDVQIDKVSHPLSILQYCWTLFKKLLTSLPPEQCFAIQRTKQAEPAPGKVGEYWSRLEIMRSRSQITRSSPNGSHNRDKSCCIVIKISWIISGQWWPWGWLTMPINITNGDEDCCVNQAWWPIHYSGQMPMWYYV